MAPLPPDCAAGDVQLDIDGVNKPQSYSYLAGHIGHCNNMGEVLEEANVWRPMSSPIVSGLIILGDGEMREPARRDARR